MRKEITPHDWFFKRSLQEKQIMQQWLKAHLPLTVLSELDLDTLTLTPTELLPKLGKKMFCDITYNCKIKDNPGYIIISAEHQSSPDKNMPFRILRYSVELMSNHLKQNNKKLPIVLPIVLYSGPTSPYPHTLDIFDCFENPELARELALKDAKLIDLTTTPNNQIAKSGFAAPMELLLKHYYFNQTAQFIEFLAPLIATTTQAVGVEYGMEPIRYLINVCEDHGNQQELEDKLSLLIKHMPQIEEKIMTLAQQLEQKGIHRVAKNLLAANVDLQTIKHSTGLTDEELAKLRKEQAN